MIPIEASALYQLDMLKSSDLVEVAEEWLMQDFDSPSIVTLAGVMNPVMSEVGPLFESCLEELGIQIPDENRSVKIVLHRYLEQIKSGTVTPFDGMRSIDEDIYRRVWFEGCEEYVGEILGLEHMYKWYRELQDAADGSMLSYYNDLPKEVAIRKFEEHLKEEAEKVLKKLSFS